MIRMRKLLQQCVYNHRCAVFILKKLGIHKYRNGMRSLEKRTCEFNGLFLMLIRFVVTGARWGNGKRLRGDLCLNIKSIVQALTPVDVRSNTLAT